MAKKKPEKFQDLEKIQSELRRWNRRDLDRWETRNRRFERDQDLYALKTPEHVTARNTADVLILNDPKVTVKKISRLIARHPNLIEITPEPGVQPDWAQVIENWCYRYDRAINQQWMLGLHHPYRYDQAFFATLRGWQALRTMFRDDEDDDDSMDEDDPMRYFDHQVFDPVDVYPYAANGRIQRVTHAYRSTVAELFDDPFFMEEAEKAWDRDEVNEDSVVTVHATYWQSEGTWWHAVLCSANLGQSTDTTWIKKPTELGYNPWTLVVGNGSAYGRTPWSDLDFMEEIGTGVLEDNADLYKNANRMATRLNELLSLEVNPPVTAYLQNGQVKTTNFFPGSRNFLTPKDKIEVHKFGPQTQDFQLLWDIISQRLARATLPPAFFAEYGGESGFSASVLLAAGKDVLFPFTEAVNMADSLKYAKALQLYRDFGPSKPMKSTLRPDGFGLSQAAELTREMLKKQGTYVAVTREDMTPQEKVSHINVGLQQVKEKAISLETFRKDYAKIKNPAAENLKVLAEQVYLSEDVIKSLIPLALSETGQEHLRRIWEITQNPLPPPEGTPGNNGQMPAGVAAMPQGMPGMPPPGMPPPGMPPGMPGMPPGMMPPGLPPGLPPQLMLPAALPPQAMPPIMNNPMAGPVPGMMDPAAMAMSQDPLLQLLNGGAIGGTGIGGVPPVPGSVPQLPI